jgi:hypothetical protein
MATTKARSKKGLSVKTFSGLNTKRMASKGGGANQGVRVVLKDGDTVPVQFVGQPNTFTEFEIHQFQEDGRWHNVPCLGDGCPLCDDESDSKSKTKYRFACPVYNLKEKKGQILEGPKDMAQKIMFRYGTTPRQQGRFLKRPWEMVRFPTNPVSYACDKGEEDELVNLKGIKFPDVMEYLDKEVKAYYGDEMPSASSLDDDDDDVAEDDDADEYTEAELKRKTAAQLRSIAKDEGVAQRDIKAAGNDKKALIALILDDEEDKDEDDEEDDEDEDEDDDEDDDEDEDEEDDEDEDDDEDDEDDDEDDEPAPPRKSARKAVKKAPAKKAAPRKATRR